MQNLVTQNNELSSNRYVFAEQFFNEFKRRTNFDRFTYSVAKRYIVYCAENRLNIQESKNIYTTVNLTHVKRINNYSTSINKVVKFSEQFNVKQILVNAPIVANFQKLIEEFIQKYDKENTSTSYRNALSNYSRFIQNRLISKSTPKEQLQEIINVTNVELFRAELLRDGKSPYTVNMYISSIKALAKHIKTNFRRFDELAELNNTERQYFSIELDNIRAVKVITIDKEEQNKGVFTETELNVLLNGSQSIQERVLIALGGFLGYRASEIISARREDFTERLYKVKGKGSRQYISREFMPSLVFVEVQNMSDNLFKNYTQINQVFKSLLNRLEIPITDKDGYKRTLHSLRHSFVTMLVNKGVKMQQVKHLARHSSFDVTERYFKKSLNDCSSIAELF